MKGAKGTLVLVVLLSLCFAGSGFAGGQDVQYHWSEQGKSILGISGGLIGIVSFGVLTMKIVLARLKGKKTLLRSNGLTLGTNLAALLMSGWMFLHAAETFYENHDSEKNLKKQLKTNLRRKK